MTLSKNELLQMWDKESKYYRKLEVGSGTQKFVKEILKSKDIFNLKEGNLSTEIEYRRNEFIEEVSKKGHLADVVIFIDSEVIIPVEIEKFHNIEAGEKQILQYQLDWNKRYGILTDGYTWRFYNNNAYRTFTLENIIQKTDEFLSFWNEYIKSDSYYIRYFETDANTSLFEEVKTLEVEKTKEIFFEDITKLISSFKNKLKIEGYFPNDKKNIKEKKAIEITYAYIIQYILYKTLVDNEFKEFKDEFTERIKGIYNALKAKAYKEVLAIIQGISNFISKNVYRPFSKEQEYISNRLEDILTKATTNLSEISPWLDIFIFIKKYNFFNVRNDIFGYIYENYLKELYEDTKKGQYFTDPLVVDFMLDQIGYTSQTISKRLNNPPDKEYISIIDPSCGSGTFLYKAVDRIINSQPIITKADSKKIEKLINDNVFGLDIAEFPLYLAEMNILMRMLPLIITEKYNNPIEKKIKVFLTKDSLSEFLDTSLRNTLHDQDTEFRKSNGQLKLFKEKLDLKYSSYVRDEGDLNELKQSLEEHPKIPRLRFDFVIGNPPYISYNESSKQGILLFNLIKEKKVKLNDIYGVNLHSIPDNPKPYRPNPNLYSFFIALGIALLKDDGKLCYIIPQTILTAGDLDVIRYHLSKFTTIEKIIIFSGKMFIGRGIKQNKPVPTSSLIIILNRRIPSHTHDVEVINYLKPSDEIDKCLYNISKGKNIRKKKIRQQLLQKNVYNWNFIKQDEKFIKFYEIYKDTTDDFSYYYDHTLAKFKYKSEFYFDSGYDIDERKILQIEPEQEYYLYPKINNNYYTIKEYRGYWPNIREKGNKYFIKLRQANQGYNLIDSKFKIIWSYSNPQKFFFSDLPLIWARNQFCAIGSDNKKEMFYIFSILNSPISKLVLNGHLKNENEKNFLVPTKAIKQLIRVPIINKENSVVKKKIIDLTKKLLEIDKNTLQDFVDFSKVISQKFTDIAIKNNFLVLINNEKRIECKIIKNKSLVIEVINNRFGSQKAKITNNKIELKELKSLPVIDYSKQNEIKKFIDDLIFILYFNVKFDGKVINNPLQIHNICGKIELYNFIFSNQ